MLASQTEQQLRPLPENRPAVGYDIPLASLREGRVQTSARPTMPVATPKAKLALKPYASVRAPCTTTLVQNSFSEN